MDEKISNLWKTNKIAFFLLLIPIGLWFARNIIIDLLVKSGNKVVGDATTQSEVLKNESTVANTKADQIIADADAQAAAKPAVGEDWNKK